MDEKREGQFRSPTYPGVYPKNMHCSYKFLGRKGQRVRVEFMDFDLFYGGPHCPFDYIKAYDGASAEDHIIGTYCGQQRNLVIFSSGENLFIQFNTLQRSADTQNRGFSGWFEFSERFVNLGKEAARRLSFRVRLLSPSSRLTFPESDHPIIHRPGAKTRRRVSVATRSRV